MWLLPDLNLQIQIESKPKKELVTEEIILAPKPTEEEVAVEMIIEETAPKPKGMLETCLKHA